MIMKKITFLLTTILFVFSGIVYSQNGDEVFVETIGTEEYVVHKFTSTGASSFMPPSGVSAVDVLIVAGGGGGSGNTAYRGAGGGAGGAGGLIFESAYTVTSNIPIPLSVGVGGNGRNGLNTPADNGEATLFDGLTALGGGGGNITPGGETTNSPAADGGSGGGGRLNPAGSGLQEGSTDGGFGNDGAKNSTDNGGGGGGGAGTQPSNITGNDGGDGGDGLDYSAFFGPSVGDAGFFAGGGGGGGDDVGAQGLGGQGGGGDGSSAIPSNLIAPSIGMANTGGGGGGGGSVHAGAAGGSGIVIIRYKLSDVDGFVFINDGNWNDNTKWENNTPPTTGANVVILANPQVTTDQTVGNIDILSTGIIVNIDNNVNLNVKGNINSLGQFTGDGEVVLNGSAAQTISGGGSFENLRINATSVDFNDPSDLFGVLYVDMGTLNTNGNLSLRCAFGTPPKTAQVGQVASGSSINGDVTVEQCFPARRAFRLLTSSVTTTGSIRQNWQENPSSYTNDPNPGYGTHITGLSPGLSDAVIGDDGVNGFDYNPSGNPSLFKFRNIELSTSEPRGWYSVANTTDILTAGEPYRLMIRGDRSIDVTLNIATPEPTRLRSTGALITGNRSQSNLLNVSGDFNLIANPYHAQVNMNSVLAASTNLSTTQYYIWNPAIGGANGRGAYVTFDLTDNSSSLSDGGLADEPSFTNQFLQPMQAAFVITGTETTAPIINFQESHKAVSQVQTRTKSLSQSEYINIQLFDSDSYNSGETPSDGLRINFDKSFSATSEDDSPKLGNLDENLARIEGNTYSAIERRPFPETEERLELFINQYRREAYVMKFNLTDNLNTKVFIEDMYLNQTQEITSNDDIYSFTVDESISESTASDRFSLVFEPISLSTVEEALVEASLYPNPTKGSFRISGANLGEDAKIEIYNMIGQQVYKTDLKNQSTTEIINFNGSAGVYLVKLKTNQGERTFKLIKQ
jgi:hypothetical protein